MLEGRLEQAIFSPVRARLARFLQANADPATGLVKGYTHAEIGDTIGALRQTVTGALSEMQTQGLIEVGHKQVRIINRQGLEEMALRGEEASR
jgi:CRP-like cAMP-binding protein